MERMLVYGIKSQMLLNMMSVVSRVRQLNTSVSLLTKDLLVANGSVFSIWGLFVISVCVFDRMCVLAAGVRKCVG